MQSQRFNRPIVITRHAAQRMVERQVTPELLLRVIDGDRQDCDAPLGADAVKTTYFDDDDTLVIRLSDKPVVREVSQDWRTHVSYAADGTVVETVILEARGCGAWPLIVEHRNAA